MRAGRQEGFELPHKSHHKIEVAEGNRKAIRAYFRAHVGVTRGECAQALGLERRTVERHIAAIRSEWANDELAEMPPNTGVRTS